MAITIKEIFLRLHFKGLAHDSDKKSIIDFKSSSSSVSCIWKCTKWLRILDWIFSILGAPLNLAFSIVIFDFLVFVLTIHTQHLFDLYIFTSLWIRHPPLWSLVCNFRSISWLSCILFCLRDEKTHRRMLYNLIATAMIYLMYTIIFPIAIA